MQTATLAATGRDNTVVWGQSASKFGTAGLRDKAVASARTGAPVYGFGLMLTVERQVVWRPEGKLVVDLLVQVTARDDRGLYCRAQPGYGAPNLVAAEAAAVRDSDPAPWLVPPGVELFTVGKGSYLGWLRIPAEGESLEVVNLRPYRPTKHGQLNTGACVRIPISGIRGTGSSLISVVT